jgi:hypothetical protein
MLSERGLIIKTERETTKTRAYRVADGLPQLAVGIAPQERALTAKSSVRATPTLTKFALCGSPGLTVEVREGVR